MVDDAEISRRKAYWKMQSLSLERGPIAGCVESIFLRRVFVHLGKKWLFSILAAGSYGACETFIRREDWDRDGPS